MSDFVKKALQGLKDGFVIGEKTKSAGDILRELARNEAKNDTYKDLAPEKNVFFPHVPGWMADLKPKEFVFESKEEIFEHDPVHFFLDKGLSLCLTDNGKTLMVETDDHSQWYVMGHFYRAVDWFPKWSKDDDQSTV